MASPKQPKPAKASNQYDDPAYNYQDYWQGREYEHAAEEMAIKKLLGRRHFEQAVDIGGGYGRLSRLLVSYADKVVLAEPSRQQLDMAKIYLKDSPQVELRHLQAADLKLPDSSADLVLVVRVIHHIPDPSTEFKEIARVLKSGGTFLLEFANDAHFLNRIRYGLHGKRVPRRPVDIRSKVNRNAETISFVNHHPRVIIEMLQDAGFKVEATLSGSNLRSPVLKKVLGKKTLLAAEKVLQPALARLYFGPSVWLSLRKSA